MQWVLSGLMMMWMSIASVCGAGDSLTGARQGFAVVVPPKASFSEELLESSRQITVRSTIDMWVQCDSVSAKSGHETGAVTEGNSWGQVILCQQPTTVEFPASLGHETTVVTFAAF